MGTAHRDKFLYLEGSFIGCFNYSDKTHHISHQQDRIIPASIVVYIETYEGSSFGDCWMIKLNEYVHQDNILLVPKKDNETILDFYKRTLIETSKPEDITC